MPRWGKTNQHESFRTSVEPSQGKDHPFWELPMCVETERIQIHLDQLPTCKMKEKHWSRSNVEVFQSQVKQKRVQKSQQLLNIGKKNWSYDAPNPPVPKASWWDPILGSHEAATCRQVHCQSPRSCHTCEGPHRKLQEIEGVLVDLGGANQHFVLL